MNIDNAVLERYSAGAQAREQALCCPVEYDRNLLAILPQEIVERDYGCGDPSRYVHSGDTVLDLGSGAGKICYMAAQLVGSQGRVIGIDMNDDMLALACKYQSAMAARLGGDRVRFLKGKIQDLALDIRAMQDWLAQHPVHSEADRLRLKQREQEQKAKEEEEARLQAEQKQEEEERAKDSKESGPPDIAAVAIESSCKLTRRQKSASPKSLTSVII